MGSNQVYADLSYVYTVYSGGLEINNIITESNVNSVLHYNGYNSVWASDEYVYLASSYNGIEYFNKSEVETVSIPNIYSQFPDITDNNVKYIHGNATKMIVSTNSGIDIIRRDIGYNTHNTSITSATKTFVTSNNYYYYTYYGDDSYHIARLNGNRSDWLVADIYYTTGSGFLEEDSIIKDFYVTEHTSTYGTNNTLLIVTDLAVYIYDEETEDIKVFTTYSGLYTGTISGTNVYNILGGTSTDFVAIWADPWSNINYGKVYVVSTGSGAALSVIDMGTNVLYDCYTTTENGMGDEVLDAEDVKDLHVGGQI